MKNNEGVAMFMTKAEKEQLKKQREQEKEDKELSDFAEVLEHVLCRVKKADHELEREFGAISYAQFSSGLGIPMWRNHYRDIKTLLRQIIREEIKAALK